MADIELVIKIPEETYKATCNGCMLPPDVENVVNGIKNSVLLPKRSESINDFDVRKYVEKHYEPVEDKPGYIWFNKRNMQIISIDTLVECIEMGRGRKKRG